MESSARDFNEIANHFKVSRETVCDWKKQCDDQSLFANPPFDLKKISNWLESQKVSNLDVVDNAVPIDEQSKTQKKSVAKDKIKQPESLWQILLTIVWPLRGWRLVSFVILLILATLALIWDGLPDKTKLTIIDSLFTVDRSYIGYYPGFEIDELKHEVDLTEWRPISQEDEGSGKVTWDVFFVCRRMRKEANVLAHYASTSGAKPEVRSQTHDVRLEHYSNSDSNHRRPQLDRYHVFLKIGDDQQIDVPFKAHLRTVRIGGFPDPNSEWASAAVIQATRKVILEVKFPENKIGRNFDYGEFPRHGKANKRPIIPDPSDLERPAPNIIRWTIRHPRVNYAYRMDWSW